MSTNVLLSNLAWTTIPSISESIAPPIALLILTSKLGPNKPINKAIKWALISGTTYVVVFWLTNTGSWMLTVQSKSIQYLTTYPQHLLSFALTAFGLLALAIYAAYSTKKSTGAQTLQELNLRAVGAIIALLGMYFLWNYLSWVFFNGAWSDWYAWFLGHNLDLWMLSLPLLGYRSSSATNPLTPVQTITPTIPPLISKSMISVCSRLPPTSSFFYTYCYIRLWTKVL